MKNKTDVLPLEIPRNQNPGFKANLLEQSYDDTAGLSTSLRDQDDSNDEQSPEHKPMTLHEKYQLNKPGSINFS